MSAGALLPGLLLLPRDEEFTKLFWLLVFFGLPLLGRLLQWILRRAGVVQDAQAGAPDRSGSREERRRKQQEGAEVWRRLLQGEEAAPPPDAPAPPVRSPAPRPEAEALAVEPQPLSVLGDAPAPSETPQPAVSLEELGPPEPLDALTAPRPELVASQGTTRPAFLLSRREARRAVLLTEILGPPLSERRVR